MGQQRLASPPGPSSTSDPLERQLERMRGMLVEYSRLFFVHMRVYTIVMLALLAASLWPPAGALVLIVPFLVPFVFLEASYLFWHTVFARRHAEWLERVLARRLGPSAPAAHRLEAAWFYPPDAPKVAALSLARPLSHMSVMTVGYTAGAGLLWAAGVYLSLEWIALQPEHPLLTLVVPAAVTWTLLIVAYLLWVWLARADEQRLLAALDEVYPEGAGLDAAAPTGPGRSMET